MITFIRTIVELILSPLILLIALTSRYINKPIDVGIGPEPLVNNIYHKKALIKYGYRAETFVCSLYFITQEFDWKFIFKSSVVRLFLPFVVFTFAVFRYKCLYIYFNGGPLHSTKYLWFLEPFLYRLAKVKTVVMPYGSDIHYLEHCPNLMFRHVMAQDYPSQRYRQKIIKCRIDSWLRRADHIIAGCDWVDYLYFWDTLTLAHFSIDIEALNSSDNKLTHSSSTNTPLKVLHAPNHRKIKGSNFIIKAVEELQTEGVPIELLLIEKVSNQKILELIKQADIVADQLIVGWYAMFALEAMSLGKPVLCYLRRDLEDFYVNAGLIKEGEIPIINCSPGDIKDTLRKLANNRDGLLEIGRRGKNFVRKHHSIEKVGAIFDTINRSLNLTPVATKSKRVI